ncbi:MAG: hypothetical protein JWN81_6 [Solirubrobacterales bacterium]|nr:hypothetical protein [Solirubrobacterales bacterium]
MPLDPASLDTDTPRTLDGRLYPAHLKVYERYDVLLLRLAMELDPFRKDSLEAHVEDQRVRAAVPRWLASAEWRGIIRRESAGRLNPPYLRVQMQRAHERLAQISGPTEGSRNDHDA